MREHASREEGLAGDRDLLRLALWAYYYKPMAGFFNAFQLRAYRTAGITLSSPMLDIGCSDGMFGVLLAEALGGQPEITGIEVNEEALRNAWPAARRLYRDLIPGSAAALPFEDRSFRTVLFNASLFALGEDVDRGLNEARRVLAEGGRLCLTVCTDLHAPSCWFARLGRRLGLHTRVERYTRSLDRRQGHLRVYPAAQWTALLARHGFEVRQCFGFFSPALTTYWSFLAWNPCRILGAARLLPGHAARGVLSRLEYHAFRRRFERTPCRLDPEASTYIWIDAVKPLGKAG